MCLRNSFEPDLMTRMDFRKKTQTLEHLKEAELIHQIVLDLKTLYLPLTQITSEIITERGFMGKIFSPITLLSWCV